LADSNVNVDMIVQTVGYRGNDSENLTNIAFTVSRDELERAKTCIQKFKNSNELQDIEISEDISKVSVVGVGMKSHAGVAAKAFKTMAKENINIMMIGTSEIKISMIIDEKYSELAVRTLHSIYNLDK
jgi:aspartate kinase